MTDERPTGPHPMLSRREALLTVLEGLVLSRVVRAPEALAGPVTTDQYGDSVQTMPRGQVPTFTHSSSSVSTLYRFAADHAGDLQYIPCFCGCKNIEHRSNLDCYIKGFNRDETVTYTSHAAT